jgi:MFS family permease
MAIATPVDPNIPADAAADRQRERRTLGVACGAHVVHDGFTDLIWVALPIWQAELALSYAAVGALRMVYTGTMASLQIPAARVAARFGGPAVLAAGTALAGLCYCLAGIADGFWWLMAALFLGGVGAATQHPIASALVTRTFTGARALSAFGAYNFAGDVGKVLIPALAALLILFMAWRPAYALFGLAGIVLALPIFLVAPRLAPERAAPQVASGEAGATATRQARGARARLGFRVLVAFGIADSVVRGALFVLLPFLLIAKGAAITTAGVALTLIFMGGAAGKLACASVARRIGTPATVVLAQALTAVGILAVLVLPLGPVLVVLPVLGIALNGVTTVIYGSVPAFVAPERRTHALSVFYTLTIGTAALAPPMSGLLGDVVGIPGAIVATAVLTVLTIPLAFWLGEEAEPAPAL